MLLSLVILATILSRKHKNVKGLLIISESGIITHKEANRHRKVMPFKKKFPNSGNTKHIRVPECYATVLIDKILVCLRVFVTELEIAASVRNTARGTRVRLASWRTKIGVFFFKDL